MREGQKPNMTRSRGGIDRSDEHVLFTYADTTSKVGEAAVHVGAILRTSTLLSAGDATRKTHPCHSAAMGRQPNDAGASRWDLECCMCMHLPRGLACVVALLWVAVLTFGNW